MRFYSFIVLFAGLTLCVAGPAYSVQKINVKGSTTVQPIAEKAAELFMKANPGVIITVKGGGSGTGFKSLLEGTVDIGNASRDAKEKERRKAREINVNLKRFVVAYDCIVPIINQRNDVNNLTIKQLRDIYLGDIRNWKYVGSSLKMPIQPISRDHHSGTFEVWNKKVLKKIKAHHLTGNLPSNNLMLNSIKRSKNTIGYVGLGYVDDRVRGVTVNNIKACSETALDGSYPLSRPLFMFTNGDPQGVIKDFIQFIKGPEGQKVVESQGFVRLN